MLPFTYKGFRRKCVDKIRNITFRRGNMISFDLLAQHLVTYLGKDALRNKRVRFVFKNLFIWTLIKAFELDTVVDRLDIFITV